MKVKVICPIIHGPQSLENLIVLNTKEYILTPFDELTEKFFDTLSKYILSDKSINRFSEITSLGFWLRKSNIRKLKSENQLLFENKQFQLSPLGKVFHICPANVDTMFVYSLAVSLLLGNKNILRISNRLEAYQVMRLFEIINQLMENEEFLIFKNYIIIISYPHSDEISSYLSSNVNARIIWGGDHTINTFKRFQTGPRTKDIVFADRISMLCLNSKSYLELNTEETDILIQRFYNDAYTFNQMGCSSPQTIYFLGNKCDNKEAILKLQQDVEKYLFDKYEYDINSLASMKLNRMVDDIIGGIITKHSGNNNFKLLAIGSEIDESILHGCGGGYFYYKELEDIGTVFSLKRPKVQTITHWGLSEREKKQLINLSKGEGIDRIVPIGEALNFHYIWDGYNLFDELSRKVRIV